MRNRKKKRHESREMLIESESMLQAREFSLTSAAFSHLTAIRGSERMSKSNRNFIEIRWLSNTVSPPSYSHSLKFFFHFDQQCMNILTHLNWRCCCHIPTSAADEWIQGQRWIWVQKYAGPRDDDWRRQRQMKTNVACCGAWAAAQRIITAIRNVQRKRRNTENEIHWAQ